MSNSTTPPVVAASRSSLSSSKKPTFVPLCDARTLLQPRKSTIDYHEPRLMNDASLEAAPQVARATADKAKTTTIPAAPGASSLFSFDNHTPESAPYAAAEGSKDGDKKKGILPTASVQANNSGNNSITTTTNSTVALDAHGGQYTILRIKRKRNEEPLDMLVVQEMLSGGGGKKAKTLGDQADQQVSNTLSGAQTLPSSSSSSSTSASPAAVFRFAATVDEASFKDPAQSIQLRDRITQIQSNASSGPSSPSTTTATTAAAATTSSSSPSTTTATTATTTSRPRSRIGMDRPDRRSILGGASTPMSQTRGELAGKMQSEAKMARYRVIQKNRASLMDGKGGEKATKVVSDNNESSPSSLASALSGPPEVKSAVQAEAEAALNMFNMLDAVKEDVPKTKKQLEDEAIESDIMCNFLPMVKEYLSISEKTVDPSIVPDSEDKDHRAPRSRMDQLLAETGQDDDDDDDDEYVYDIYYRDMNTDQYQASQYRAVGSLLWYENDGEENFIHEEDSSGDDYEDSDSNAEDYFMNDYPEEEDSDQYAYELSDTDDDEYMY